MKRFVVELLIGILLVLLAGCSPSNIQQSNDTNLQGLIVPDDLTGDMTLPETSEYVIPADAETGENGGPGAMETTAADYSYYPEDKQPSETVDNGILVILYVPRSGGIFSTFDFVDTLDEDSLMEVLVNNNTITDDVTLESFEMAEDGNSASIIISNATSVYEAASEEEVVTAIANTFIDNLGLDTVSLSVTSSGNTYTDLSYSQKFNANKKETDSTTDAAQESEG